jgi:uncharacterized protein (TIGR02594 family)
MTLPAQYAWLAAEPGPATLIEALKIFGTHEAPGAGDNPVILSWAKELGISWYVHDETPWCGLAAGIVVKRAGFKPPRDLLAAGNWVNFGIKVTAPMFMDVLVYERPGGHHVHFYVGEDAEAYHGLGGNQSDMFNVARTAKSRLIGAFRPVYLEQPANIRKIILSSTGAISVNEA